jgi:hypothetical protein
MDPANSFRKFVERVDELSSLRVVQSGMRWSLNITYETATGVMRQRIDGPDEEDLRSLLLTFRHFISEDEPVFVARVLNECIAALTDSEVRQMVEEARTVWHRLIKSGPLDLSIDGVRYTPERCLDYWLNGHYFHSDEEKATTLETLSRNRDDVLVRWQFLDCLASLTGLILWLGNVVRRHPA